MNQVVVRSTFTAAGAMLLAFTPIYAAYTAHPGENSAAVSSHVLATEAGNADAPTGPALVPAPALLAPAVAIAIAPVPAISLEAADRFRGEATLRPGAYIWEPDLASAGPVEIVVSIPLQRAFVYRGGILIGVSTVSTGKPGHATPVGTFDILEKRREHYSNKYNNAPMPFMQRLTWDGVALHAGHIPGRPASHGCVRLPKAFARLLFGVTKVGASVHVIKQSPSAGEALAMVSGGGGYNGMGGPLEESDAGGN